MKAYLRSVKPGCKAPNDGEEYSQKDDEIIRRMSAEGKTDNVIGQAIGHTGHAVGQRRYFKLGIGKKPLPAPTRFTFDNKSGAKVVNVQHIVDKDEDDKTFTWIGVWCPADTTLEAIKAEFVAKGLSEYFEQWRNANGKA